MPFGLCPWAASAWREGETETHVSRAATFAPGEVVAFADGLESETRAQIGFFVMPRFAGRPATWERHAEEARRALGARPASCRAWHVAAFHPDFPTDFASPGQLVSVLRRTAEPMLQLVATAALDAVAQGPQQDVSRGIGQRNFAVAQRDRAALEQAVARLHLRAAEARASKLKTEA